MSRILVTGATGFIGSHVVRVLLKEQQDVTLLIRPGSDRWRLAGTEKRCAVIESSLADLPAHAHAVEAGRPEAVIHLAWGGVKGASRNDLVQLRNVEDAFTLYRVAADAGCRHFVGLGSQAEYGLLSGRIDEQASTDPTTLYGAAKLATLIALRRAAGLNDAKFAWLRIFSTYGPNDDPAWLIPYLVRSLLQGETPKLTACGQMWDYLHVEDAARAIVSVTLKKVDGVFNLGSGQSAPLRHIVETIRDIAAPGDALAFGAVPYRDDQVMHLEADISAIQEATGWAPAIGLDAGIRDIVEQQRGHYE